MAEKKRFTSICLGTDAFKLFTELEKKDIAQHEKKPWVSHGEYIEFLIRERKAALDKPTGNDGFTKLLTG